ncbi:ABC transporter ATP-binding protein [Thermobifida halotolerans]|uniref:ABC transporter ATP-binding protein n=1 Tax=Thermobifida halotolerans TaxID=483545 RepID=A0A399G4K5_9ACTN|nr:ABC transporter ATP-binding protein [Thermobifida halotolerans]UOE20792.1 ABC transporter ATP-binding protein [Thermobifida halotolerans]
MTSTDHADNTAPAARADVVLDVADLNVRLPTDDGEVHAVRGVSYRLRRGEALGIVGESGSGKSVAALAVMGLLPRTARVSGSVRVLGQQVIGLPDAAISRVRGARIAMVFQDPLTSLNPVYTIGRQIAEAVQAHRDVSNRAARERAVELLRTVGVPLPEQRVDSYPHEISGGMRQRVVIAIAMAGDPDVIIADEPTTALDVTVQAQVLEALEAARRATGAALVLITHDLGVVAGHVDRVAVMYAGRIVETGPVDDVFYGPRMPYTLGLLGSQPRMDAGRRARLTPVPGSPPSPAALPPGCVFAPRCPMAEETCRSVDPPLAEVGGAHAAACHLSDRLADTRPEELFAPAPQSGAGTGRAAAAATGGDDVVLVADGLVKHYPVRSGGLVRRRVGSVHAVCGVSLELRARQTLALVGESGCGKSTVARLLLNLVPATRGEVRYRGRELTGLSRARMRPLRQRVQILFQDPLASLDPRMTVFETVAEPLRVHGRFADGGRRRVRELLRLVGLDPEHGNRYPHEFSGGQRQRVGIARALALEPEVLVLDEPVSALDVSIRAGVVNLLEELRDRLGLSYLFVSHDLSVVRHVADRVAVMYLGRIVETAPVERLFSAAAHPYTQALVSAVPLPDPRRERARERIVLGGDVPSPLNPPSGCRFRTRCPVFARLSEGERARCVEEVPPLAEQGDGHAAACHYARTRGMV